MTKQSSTTRFTTTTAGKACQLVQNWLPGYLHRELTAVRQQQVQAHLARCDSCAQMVQEARLLDAELQAEADRQQPNLPPNASRRIQRQVYRRMRRSLAWQRTCHYLRLATAVTALGVLLVGSFWFGRFWLPILGNPTAENTPGETAVYTEAPSTTLPAGSSQTNAWDRWRTVTPGQTPEQIAATILDAALARDSASLTALFVGMGASGPPTADLWLRIGGGCPQIPAGRAFAFVERPISLPDLTSISILYDDRLVGEIKMRRAGGEWFATFARTPAVNLCLK